MEFSYLEVEELLENTAATMGAAEVHGLFCGLLCMQPSLRIEDCVSILYEDELSENETEVENGLQRLAQLLEWVRQNINDSNLKFELFLPDDDDALSLRVRSLKTWCQGYLYGLGVGGIDPEKIDSEEVTELLNDFSHLIQIDSENVEADEEGEQDYFELTEFVRIGVLYIQEEISPDSGRQVIH